MTSELHLRKTTLATGMDGLGRGLGGGTGRTRMVTGDVQSGRPSRCLADGIDRRLAGI